MSEAALAPEVSAISNASDASDASPLAVRELMAVREIAHAFLVAERPSEVFQFALDRVTPLLGATFSLVMQLSADTGLLRPVAQHQWPAQHRAWIGALRVRIGDGPSGMAVAERRLVEIGDVLGDERLVEWHEVARELGFRSILAAPLPGAQGPVGAIAFYFAEATEITEEQRALVRVVADQLAATAEKASAMDALRRANAALADANDTLERQAVDAAENRATRDAFVDDLTTQLERSLRNPDGAEPRTSADALLAAQAISRAARELTLLQTGKLPFDATDVDAREPLLNAVQRWRERLRTLPFTVDEPTVLLPTMHTDASRVQRALELLLGHAANACPVRDGTVRADIQLGSGFVAYRVRWAVDADAPDRRGGLHRHATMSSFDVPLAMALAVSLGGELRFSDDEGTSSEGASPDDAPASHAQVSRGVSLILPLEPASVADRDGGADLEA